MGDRPPSDQGNLMPTDMFNETYNASTVPGLDFGNPLLNMLVAQFMQGRMFPRPIGGTNQSPYDSIRWQQRNLDYFAIRNKMFATQMLAERLGGLNANGMITSMMSDPNGMVAKFLSPFAGGNPMAAAMHAYGSLTTQSLAFMGRPPGEITPMETSQMMRALDYKFYNRGLKSSDIVTDENGNILPSKINTLLAQEGHRAVGQNWAGNMGFKLEDIMGGFTGAAREGLFMGRGTPEQLFGKFLGVQNPEKASGALRIMDAARGVFGNAKSGEELMRDLSHMLGPDTVGTDTDSQAKLEELLRRMKATARILGVDIEVLKGMSETVQTFAKQHNLSPGMGGMAGMEAAMSALSLTTLEKQFGGAANMRRMGGEVSVGSSLLALSGAAADQPITKWLGAIYNQADLFNNENVKKSVLDYMNNPSSNKGMQGYNQLLIQSARSLGMEPWNLQSYAQNNVLATQEGLKAIERAKPDSLTNMLGGTYIARVQAELARQVGPNVSQAMLNMVGDENLSAEDAARKYGVGGASFSRLQALEHLRSNSPDKILSIQQLAEFFPRGGQIISGNPAWQPAGQMALRYQYNPAYRNARASLAEQLRVSTALESQMAEKLAKFNAPVLTQLANNLFNGELSAAGIQGIIKDFGYPDVNEVEAQSLYKELIGLQRISDPGGLKATEYYGLVNKDIKQIRRSGGEPTASPELKQQFDLLQKLDPTGRLPNLDEKTVRDAVLQKKLGEFIEARMAGPMRGIDTAFSKQFLATTGTTADQWGGEFSIVELQKQLDSPQGGALKDKYNTLSKNWSATTKQSVAQSLDYIKGVRTSHFGKMMDVVKNVQAEKEKVDLTAALKEAVTALGTIGKHLENLAK